MLARGIAPVLLVACATMPSALGDEAKDALKKLQGAWVYTDSQGQENRWVFEGDVLKSPVNGNEYVSNVTIDPKAGPLPTIDFKLTKAPDDSVGKTVVGIYRLEGDHLTLCVSVPGRTTRPTEFKRIEDETMLFELKRAN